jgi:hypothetical protein
LSVEPDDPIHLAFAKAIVVGQLQRSHRPAGGCTGRGLAGRIPGLAVDRVWRQNEAIASCMGRSLRQQLACKRHRRDCFAGSSHDSTLGSSESLEELGA